MYTAFPHPILLTGDFHASISRRNAPDLVAIRYSFRDRRQIRFGTNHDHPDPHIKSPEHLFFINIAELLHHAEYWEFGPGASVYFYGDTRREDAGDVFEKAAAGDVDEAFYNA